MKSIQILLFVLLLPLVNIQSENKAWFIKSSEAKNFAMTNNTPILLVFAGSDWCKPCMMFKNEVLKSTVFENWQEKKLAVLYLDFPMHAKNKLPDDLKKQNDLLAEKYNKSGFFPNIVMIDTQGKILSQMEYKNQTPEAFIQECETILKSNTK